MSYVDDENCLTTDDDPNDVAEAQTIRAEIVGCVSDALRGYRMPEGVGPLYSQYVTVAALVQVLGDLLVAAVANDHDPVRAGTWCAETIASLELRIVPTSTLRAH